MGLMLISILAITGLMLLVGALVVGFIWLIFNVGGWVHDVLGPMGTLVFMAMVIASLITLDARLGGKENLRVTGRNKPAKQQERIDMRIRGLPSGRPSFWPGFLGRRPGRF